jgi:hypothetical protein
LLFESLAETIWDDVLLSFKRFGAISVMINF